MPFAKKSYFSRVPMAIAGIVGITLSYNYHPRRSKYRGTGAGNAEKNRL